jgi:hypothetical protein
MSVNPAKARRIILSTLNTTAKETFDESYGLYCNRVADFLRKDQVKLAFVAAYEKHLDSVERANMEAKCEDIQGSNDATASLISHQMVSNSLKKQLKMVEKGVSWGYMWYNKEGGTKTLKRNFLFFTQKGRDEGENDGDDDNDDNDDNDDSDDNDDETSPTDHQRMSGALKTIGKKSSLLNKRFCEPASKLSPDERNIMR